MTGIRPLAAFMAAITIAFFALIGAPGAPGASAAGEEGSSEGNPLQPFERLIGGRWELEGSYQEFEWGVGGKSVVSRGYFVIDGVPKQVSGGLWYWHPGEKVIRGVFVAIDMPVALFDYTTRFEGDRMVSDLRSYSEEGDEEIYTEVYDLGEDNQYEWTLFKKTDDGPKRAMGGVYVRR